MILGSASRRRDNYQLPDNWLATGDKLLPPPLEGTAFSGSPTGIWTAKIVAVVVLDPSGDHF